jgi:hypothetical protein
MIDEPINTITLDAEQVRDIRKALVIGLTSYGEIERLSNLAGMADLCGKSVEEDSRPIHPTGSADTVGIFASALAYLNAL